MADWTFLTKHAHVLSIIAKHPYITAQQIATNIGITERAVRKIIADLYANKYISKKRVGRGTEYRINPVLRLRHRTNEDIAIGDLLKTLGWEKKRSKTRLQKNKSKVTLVVAK